MKTVFAEIITIGDEILYGQTLDTNAHWMSRKLDEAGIKVRRKFSIGDQKEEILSALKESEARVDVVLITGGLGPTKDDLTKPCLAEYFQQPLLLHQEALQDVTNFFNNRGKKLTDLNRKQAEMPTNAQLIHNYHGSAPGMWFKEGNTIFISMPGVPFEMKKMMLNEVIPRLKSVFNIGLIVHRIIHTVGIGESWLSELIADWESNLPEPIKLAYLPSMGQVKLRLTAIGENSGELSKAINEQINKLLPLAGQYVFGYDDVTFPQAIGDLLITEGKTVAVAESCSGGYVSHLLTSIPGSSRYFNGSIVAYQNEIKKKHLQVGQEILAGHGAVSEPTVKQMASRVREMFNADYGLAISGIAGPSGGSPQKPVGTVWIALADDAGVITKKLQLGAEREINIKLSAIRVLDLLRRRIGQLKETF